MNVQSDDGSDVEFLLRARFDHPITAELDGLETGIHPLPPRPGGLALDYVRANLFQPQDMTTETGRIELEIPRDRQASVDPQLIAKYQRRFPGFDEKIVSIIRARHECPGPEG